MKRFAKYIAVTAVTLTMMAGVVSASVYAAGAQPQSPQSQATQTAQQNQQDQTTRQGPPPDDQHGRGGPRGGGSLEGKVTAVTGAALTVQTGLTETVTANITTTTHVRLMLTGSDGSLSDIKVGASVQVSGRRNSAGQVEARDIVVQPDGDKLNGRVTAVDGSTITVETAPARRRSSPRRARRSSQTCRPAAGPAPVRAACLT